MIGLSDGDIQATIGQFAASLGDTSNEKSGKAIIARQRVGDIATYHYPDNMARAIQHAGRIIVDLIPYYYDTQRIARVLGEDGEADIVQLNPEIDSAYQEQQDINGKIQKIYNVGVGQYDVAVTVGPSYNTKRQDAAESMAQMTQANPQLWGIIGDMLVKNMDWPGAEDMAKRLKATIPPEIRQDEDEDMDPEVAAQFQQMEGMFKELQMSMGEQMQGLVEENQKLQETINTKVIERDMKAAENEVKMAELDVKRSELAVKQTESAEKLALSAEKQELEFNALAELVQTAANSSLQTQQLLAALAESNQTQGEMLAAMLQELGKPRMMQVEFDADGNVVGGVSRTVN